MRFDLQSSARLAVLGATCLLLACGGKSPSTPVALVSGGAPTDLAVDASFVYFGGYSSLKKVPLDGGASIELATMPTASNGIVVAGGSVFWTFGDPSGANGLLALPTTGGTAISLGPGTGTVVADAANVYWIASGDVMARPLAGGTPIALGHYADPIGLAVAGGQVFFAAQGEIMKVSSGGGAPVPLTAALGDVTAIATEGGSVYWAELFGAIRKVPASGGPVTTLVPSANPAESFLTSMAVDSSGVYWTLDGRKGQGGVVKSAPLDGGSSFTLARGERRPVAIALDRANVYWVDEGVSSDGAVMKARKP